MKLLRPPGATLSAIFAFVAAALIANEALHHNASGKVGSRRAAAVLVVLAVVIAVVGLEEVSWFQRVFGIESPEAFRDRGQPELNFHNGATALFENFYYGGAFVFAVLLPHLLAGRRMPEPVQWLEVLIPTRLVFYGAGVAAALTYEMWEIIPIQLAFYGTLVALARDPSPPGNRYLALSVVVVMVALQAMFLAWGHEMYRSWDNTELREVLIPYGFLLYGLGLRRSREFAAEDPGLCRSNLATGRG